MTPSTSLSYLIINLYFLNGSLAIFKPQFLDTCNKLAVRPYSVPFILGIILVNLCRKIVPSKEDSEILKYGSQAIINLDSKLPNYELLGTIKFYFHNGSLAIYKPLDTRN